VLSEEERAYLDDRCRYGLAQLRGLCKRPHWTALAAALGSQSVY
jgi:hypothetical protein